MLTNARPTESRKYISFEATHRNEFKCDKKWTHAKLILRRFFCWPKILSFNFAIDNDYDYVYYGFPGEEEEEEYGVMFHIGETNSISRNSIAIRKNFPETWLWTEIANIRLNLF